MNGWATPFIMGRNKAHVVDFRPRREGEECAHWVSMCSYNVTQPTMAGGVAWVEDGQPPLPWCKQCVQQVTALYENVIGTLAS